VKAKIAFVVLAAIVPFYQQRLDATLGEQRATEEALYVWSGSYVKRLSPGFENVMADIYWLRTVQYFGSQRAFAKDKRYDLVEPLTQITVALDYRFEIAYHYGAVFLAEPWPRGADKAERAVALLKQGADATGSWRLRQLEGYFTLVFLNDAPKAAEILLEASKLPGAAYWLKTLAADALSRAGDRELARRIWLSMSEQSEPGAIRANAEFNLQQLKALDERDALQEAVIAFEAETRRRPRSLRELSVVRAGKIPVVDPAGVPYEYDEASGLVSVSRKSSMWRRPIAHL